MNPKVSMVDEPCSGSRGQQRSNTTACLLDKLSDEVNSYLSNLGDTFNDWRITLGREDRLEPQNLQEYTSVPSDNLTNSSVVTPYDYMSLCASKPMV